MAAELVKKPFDITKHEWVDSLRALKTKCSSLYIEDIEDDDHIFELNKDDAIAIAKYFGLTAEVLK
jgi:hypothetical protein